MKMTNWEHVKSDLVRSLLEGRAPADRINLGMALDIMLNEQDTDSTDLDIPEDVFFGRAERMDLTYDALRADQLGLALTQIKAFYLI